ncbi:MAG: hypothetical protein IJE43_19100 [Alphaproteobacteria bacterium]|nr:hypothetical protein [Alphaproteobacteria bacterium]
MNPKVVIEWLQLAVLVLVLGIGSYNVSALFRETSTPIIRDYQDKTALDAKGSLMVEGAIKTGADLMFALINSDLNLPYPRSIKINSSPIIDLNNAFIANLDTNLALIYSSVGEYKLSTMLDYKVTKVEYIWDDVNGDYWHYTLSQ